MIDYKSREEWHRTFGGLIYPNDFEYVHDRSYAKRISSDLSFNEQCRRNIERMKRLKENDKQN